MAGDLPDQVQDKDKAKAKDILVCKTLTAAAAVAVVAVGHLVSLRLTVSRLADPHRSATFTLDQGCQSRIVHHHHSR
jgi:hypothetical protein